MQPRSSEDLIAWRIAMEVAAAIHRLTANYPKNETYGMISQMRRAAVSVPSNIAEGQSRLTTGEFKHFLGIARGSLAELNTQLHLSVTLDLTTPADAEVLLSRVAELGRVLNAYSGRWTRTLATSH